MHDSGWHARWMRRVIGLLACATVAGGPAAAEPPSAEAGRRPHVVIVVADDEYRTAQTLPAFAAAELGGAFRVSTLAAVPGGEAGIPGLETLADADLLVISVRRRPLPAAQLDRIRRHVAAGRPVVGIRTANHAFHLRNAPPPQGLEDWRSFDADVFGGNYSNHLANDLRTTARRLPGVEHPILEGLPAGEFATGGSLYVVTPLAASTTELLRGRAAGVAEEQPVAWVNRRADGGWSFYTSLGHPDDFEAPAFRRLLANAIRWTASAERAAPDAARPAATSR